MQSLRLAFPPSIALSSISRFSLSQRPSRIILLQFKRASSSFSPPPHRAMDTTGPVLHDTSEDIREELVGKGLSKWGWVIYRSTYGDDETWQRFLDILKQGTGAESQHESDPGVTDMIDWKVMEGPEFADASKDAVREYFKAWTASDEAKAEQPNRTINNEDGSLMGLTPRYTFCVHVDTDALESVMRLSTPLDQDYSCEAYLNLIDARWDYESVTVDYATGEKFDGENEVEVDGYKCHDVGWMKVGARPLWGFVYSTFITENLFEASYVRPPQVFSPL
ncbi:hypothetical protein K402DRAFT_391467 [Aulographum hederae CBS 113979]|uniref:Uncharacterized protein n=1 Tax=Aulographum hederae CBS 113979 TaxID=1176131 RepID=A0A6G1H6B7_9PEZI|nr:hypothetical protein K402DRAFT_391467 [Aulographum hederae CBS 113979]